MNDRNYYYQNSRGIMVNYQMANADDNYQDYSPRSMNVNRVMAANAGYVLQSLDPQRQAQYVISRVVVGEGDYYPPQVRNVIAG